MCTVIKDVSTMCPTVLCISAFALVTASGTPALGKMPRCDPTMPTTVSCLLAVSDAAAVSVNNATASVDVTRARPLWVSTTMMIIADASNDVTARTTVACAMANDMAGIHQK